MQAHCSGHFPQKGEKGGDSTVDGKNDALNMPSKSHMQLQASFCHLGGHGETHAPTNVIYATSTATTSAPTISTSDAKPKDDIDWIKGLAAAVLFIEALLGVFLPLLRGVKAVDRAMDQWLLSLLNCFAGGVFITFGATCTATSSGHILPT